MELQEQATKAATDISGVETTVGALNAKLARAEEEITSLKTDIEKLRSKFKDLCTDEAPMVRRAAASRLTEFAEELKADAGLFYSGPVTKR